MDKRTINQIAKAHSRVFIEKIINEMKKEERNKDPIQVPEV